MISTEQIERVRSEMAKAARDAFEKARASERELEHYTYYVRPYDPAERDRLLSEYREADYMAESRAWMAALISAAPELLEALQAVMHCIDNPNYHASVEAMAKARAAIAKATGQSVIEGTVVSQEGGE